LVECPVRTGAGVGGEKTPAIGARFLERAVGGEEGGQQREDYVACGVVGVGVGRRVADAAD